MSGKIRGFVDIHNHQFAYLGFGGMAFHGRAFGDMADALSWCTPVHGPGGTQDFIGNIMKSMYGSSILGHKVGGYPDFDGWPRWDSVTHQAVYEDWLYRAVQGGLRLMVMLAINNEYLCGKANTSLSCNDMEAVDRQLAAAKDMEAYIDNKNGGPGNGWYRIAYSPQQARTIIEAGKLAVVLGIEVDYLFNCHAEADLPIEGLYADLDKYYSLGVRHLFPIHFGDNGFGGTAFQNGLEWGYDDENPGSTWNHTTANPLNPLPTVGAYEVHTEGAAGFGYQYRTARRNVKGLTDLGKGLIHGMIDRGMIIDVDHMSARSKVDTLDICDGVDYPVVASHAGFVEISNGDKSHEGQLLPEEVERIRRLGGMIAVIVHQGKLDEIKTWSGPGQTVVPHTCGNTSNSVVQAYLYAVSKMQGGPVGFGTDFNGFAGLPGPRFGSDAANGGGVPGTANTRVNYPFTAAVTGQSMDCSIVGNKSFNINDDGLAHVGMLPDLIADFQAMGLTGAELEPMLSSAEGYVALWEKTWHHMTISYQDGSLVGAGEPGIFVIYGGAKFHVPNPDVFNAIFPNGIVRDLGDGALDGIPTIPRDGTLLREQSGTISVTYGGAKFHVPNPDVFNDLFSKAPLCQLWDGALDGIPTIPRDGTLLREQSGAVSVTYGGAKFHVPNPEIFNAFFSNTPFGQLWDGALDGIPTIPRDGTLLREQSGAVSVTYGGAKFHVPNPDVFNAFFSNTPLCQLWDGALDGIPTIPRDGTLLREQSSTQIYIISGGLKQPAPAGVIGIIHVLWDGALAQIPAHVLTDQSDWRWCRKCQGLFFGDNPGSVCPAGGPHDSAGSYNYTLVMNSPDAAGRRTHKQSNWRWCRKCQGLFFSDNPDSVCPAGGSHDSAGSGNYSIEMNSPQATGQSGWSWCHKCQGLFFGGNPGSVCPAGGSHDSAGSGNYTLPGI